MILHRVCRLASILAIVSLFSVTAAAAGRFVVFEHADGAFPLINNSSPASIVVDSGADEAVEIAVANLAEDFGRVCGTDAVVGGDVRPGVILVGTVGTPVIDRLVKQKKIDGAELKGKREKYLIQLTDGMLVIAGSDRRGAVYGVYELSQQLGVSPWYWWADVPVTLRRDAWVLPGVFTDGEPAVEYRGLFLNDEAPCLTGWVKNHYGTDFGGHEFYADVFELILRLKGNFMWPAMWSWAFYADDSQNSETARRMGIIMGTSHHEPMARNHQEYARRRGEYGAWNYATNKESLDKFFAEGIRRVKDTEDIITIGMRGDGDEAMENGTNIKLMETIVKKQRKIIARETGRKASETPQVWALYKEVLDYYDAGMRVPDDVIMLLCDDNWGNVRRLPDARERKHPGGWGMYYHVDYVGAPRNSKLINVTPVQGMWEQLNLTYLYGVDRLWVLNVGDLKPMEYPITLFLDMAWNPSAFTIDNLMEHVKGFFAEAFGEEQAGEAARIFNLYCKYNGRVTPELLDADTYNLASGEWKQVSDDYTRLEAEALRQFLTLAPEQRDAYRELILFPVQLMSNLYEMYYSQAMNRDLFAKGDPRANYWADNVERCFGRDRQLCDEYNHEIAGGKWNGMMTQKHIGYTIWNDDFAADTMPQVKRIDDDAATARGGYTVECDGRDYVSIEAEHFLSAEAPQGTEWTVYPDMGRTLSGVAVTPYDRSPESAVLTYSVAVPEQLDSVTVHIVTKSTLAFSRLEGHRFSIGFAGGASEEVNMNSNLNEAPENIYTVFYPTVASRVIESEVRLAVPHGPDGYRALRLMPLDPGIVFEKIVVDFGGYTPQRLFGPESAVRR